MGKVTVQSFTTKNPITLAGMESGICWGADTTNDEKNFKRGLDCLRSDHGRTLEYAQIYLILEDWSARVIRELYTHIADNPTRLQGSTRYIDYSNFTYVMPPSLNKSTEAQTLYSDAMENISGALQDLENCGVPREDIGMLLPLGMTTKIVYRTNLRSLITMSHKRMCSRAYWEFRDLMKAIIEALSSYSEEWRYLVYGEEVFVPQCKALGYCPESHSCGAAPSRNDFEAMKTIMVEIRKTAPIIDGQKIMPQASDAKLFADYWKSMVELYQSIKEAGESNE